jgi:uncharacterized peroxidase-related enzyme
MDHHGAALRSITGDEALVRSLRERGAAAELPSDLKAILTFAEKLTLRPWDVRKADLDPLREAGLDDRAILEVAEVTAYFNFVNRLADGLGVALEPAGHPGSGPIRS